jgi:hypothetical protein
MCRRGRGILPIRAHESASTPFRPTPTPHHGLLTRYMTEVMEEGQVFTCVVLIEVLDVRLENHRAGVPIVCTDVRHPMIARNPSEVR